MDDVAGEIQKFQEDIKKQMTHYRFRHTLGVVETAKDLAVIYQVDCNKAAIAALFHDLAKEFTEAKKRELCKAYNIPIDDFLNNNIHLAHGLIAGSMVWKEYHIEDQDIINAINHHTLGASYMSDLEKIIYLADLIEPNRAGSLELNKLRKLAYTHLNKAMKFALNYNITYLKAKNKEIHPMIYSMLEEYN